MYDPHSLLDTQFSLADLYAIRGIAEESNLFNLLIASFCPSICGRELVKMAILLATFGGSANSWRIQEESSKKVPEESPELSPSSEESEGVDECCYLNEAEILFDNAYSTGDDMPIRRSSSHVLFVGKYLCFR